MTGLAPIGNRFFDESGLGIMLGEKLGLGFHQLGGKGFERLGDLRVQLLPSAAQQAAVRRILHQSVLEVVNRVRRHPRWKTSSAATRRARAARSSSSGRSETARS